MPSLARLALLAVFFAGCSAHELKKSQLSGKVLFKGKPVPAGYISFMPDASQGNRGEVRLVQIKDGEYNTTLETDPGIYPGPTLVRIAGFDGKPLRFFPQGKQIFNPYEFKDVLPDGNATKDFTVPPSAADHLKIEPTADVP